MDTAMLSPAAAPRLKSPLILDHSPSEPFTSSTPGTPMSPLAARRANIGKRRSRVETLLNSPARPGHSQYLAGLFQQTRASILRIKPGEMDDGDDSIDGGVPLHRSNSRHVTPVRTPARMQPLRDRTNDHSTIPKASLSDVTYPTLPTISPTKTKTGRRKLTPVNIYRSPFARLLEMCPTPDKCYTGGVPIGDPAYPPSPDEPDLPISSSDSWTDDSQFYIPPRRKTGFNAAGLSPVRRWLEDIDIRSPPEACEPRSYSDNILNPKAERFALAGLVDPPPPYVQLEEDQCPSLKHEGDYPHGSRNDQNPFNDDREVTSSITKLQLAPADAVTRGEEAPLPVLSVESSELAESVPILYPHSFRRMPSYNSFNSNFHSHCSSRSISRQGLSRHGSYGSLYEPLLKSNGSQVQRLENSTLESSPKKQTLAHRRPPLGENPNGAHIARPFPRKIPGSVHVASDRCDIATLSPSVAVHRKKGRLRSRPKRKHGEEETVS